MNLPLFNKIKILLSFPIEKRNQKNQKFNEKNFIDIFHNHHLIINLILKFIRNMI